MDGNAPNEQQQNPAPNAPNDSNPNPGNSGGGGWGGDSSNNNNSDRYNNGNDRRGGGGGYNDRRGGYNDRRGGGGGGGYNDRRGGGGGYNDRRGGGGNRRWGGGDRFEKQEGRELYCGNLPLDANEDELHDLFRKYGHIQRVKVMPARRNAESKFAFVEFANPNDAQEAARGRDGIKFADNNIRVEISRPRPPRRDRDDRGGYGGDRFDRGGYNDRRRGFNDRGGDRFDRGGRSFNDRRQGGGRDRDRAPRPEYASSTCVFVDNLLAGTRWGDLADALTKVAPVLPGTVRMNRGGRGATVRFERKEDAERVIAELHGTDFGSDGNTTKIELKLAPPREERRRGGDRGDRGDRGRGRDDRREDRRDERPPQEDRPREDRQTSRSRSPVRDHGREPGEGATNQTGGQNAEGQNAEGQNAEEQQAVAAPPPAADTTAEPEETSQPAEEPAEEAAPAEASNGNGGEKQDSSGGKPDYDSMSYADLRGLCKEKGISASGKKAELIEKLKEA